MKIEKGLSNSTVGGIKHTFSSALDYAVNPLNFIKTNPCASVKLPKFEKTAKKREKKTDRNRLFYGEHYTRIYLKDEVDEKNNTINKLVEVNSDSKINLKEVNMICRKENGEYLNIDSFKYCSRFIRKELGINFNYHSLRHTYATNILENGANINAVQERLRHSNIDTTLNIYNHLTKKVEDEAVNIIENIMIK